MISPFHILWRRLSPAVALTGLALSSHACIGIEEVPAQPYIDTYKPTSGYVEVDLATDDGKVTFSISEYGDERGEQKLYHRVVIDYRQLSGSSSLVEATYPQEIADNSRDIIGYLFPTCQIVRKKGWDTASLESKTVMIYFVLADSPFKDPNISFDAGTFSQAFAVKSGGSSTWVSWTLHFNGNCASSQ